MNKSLPGGDLIVLDLEWNQCPYGKDLENPRLPFEIIEIGAVKLNRKHEILDTFRQLIKPKVYKRLHHQTRKVVTMSMDELKEGMPFPAAAKAFFAWCGEDPLLCTWGPGDLTELQRNLEFYDLFETLPGPILYEDVQKLFAISFENKHERRALHYAVEFLQIKGSEGYHEALTDALYTAKVLQRIPEEVLFRAFSVDCYRTPLTREEELYLRYGDYEKFISMVFSDKKKLLNDKEVMSVHCFTCGKNAKRLLPYFSDNGRNYYAVGDCPKHGMTKSKVRVRQDMDGDYYAVKTTKHIGEAALARLIEKREHVKERHRSKKERRRALS